jgi:hypothetical protein
MDALELQTDRFYKKILTMGRALLPCLLYYIFYTTPNESASPAW